MKKNPTQIFLSIVLLLIVATSISMIIKSSSSNGDSEEDRIIDASKYSGITSEKLVEEMGEPEGIEDWNNTKADGSEYPVKTYTYNSGKLEFLIADNKVIRLNVYSDKYITGEGEDFKLNYKQKIFLMLGIDTASDMEKVVDNNVALRYQMVSNKIADVWIPEIKDKTFSSVKITYDLSYFE